MMRGRITRKLEETPDEESLLLPVVPSGAQREWYREPRRVRLSRAGLGFICWSIAILGLAAICVIIQTDRSRGPASSSVETEDLQKKILPAAAETATVTAEARAQEAAGEADGRPENEAEIVPNVPGKPNSYPKATAVTAAAAGTGQRTTGEGGAGERAGGASRGQEEVFDTDLPSSPAERPNVFIIMIDDMGWNDIGYHSTDLGDMTPNLNRLAASGVKMTQYYSMSICTPARAALMTGRYPVRYGLQYSVIQPGAPWGLPVNEKLFPEYMHDAGYESHMIGKWHLGSYSHPHMPQQRGFETYLGYLNDEEMYWTHQSWTATLNGRKFFDFGFGNATAYYDVIERNLSTPDDDLITTGPSSSVSSSSNSSPHKFRGKYSTEIFTDRALEILNEKTPYDDERMFLYLSHQAVHDPLGIPPADAFSPEELALLTAVEESTASSLRVRFAKVLMYLDKSIGRLVDYLEAEGWLENSIVVVSSDNGGCPAYGGSNYPLKGIKHSYWEGGVKVPALMYSRSHIPKERWGTEYKGLMHVTDWLPTVAGAVGLELSGSNGDLDGVSHWEYIIANTTDDNSTAPASNSTEAETAAVGNDMGTGTTAGVWSSGSDDLGATTYGARNDVLYNYDPYTLATAGSKTNVKTDHKKAQGAFRQGKWKYMFNSWCSGYYAFDLKTTLEDHLTDESNACPTFGACPDCGGTCSKLGDNYTSWLFDLEDDPREEHNLAHLYPEMVESLRERVTEIVFQEYATTLYKSIDKESYDNWREYGYWMVPWSELKE